MPDQNIQTHITMHGPFDRNITKTKRSNKSELAKKVTGKKILATKTGDNATNKKMELYL